MATESRTWFGNRGVVAFGTTSADNVVAIAKDIEVTVTGEFEELYGLGSTLRQDVAQHTKKVNVRFTIYKFDPASDLWSIINPASSTPPVSLATTSAVQTFVVDVYLDKDETEDENSIKLSISDVYFESLPFTVNDTEWIGLELEGVGRTIELSNEAYSTGS